jgi:hypothetical protein
MTMFGALSGRGVAAGSPVPRHAHQTSRSFFGASSDTPLVMAEQGAFDNGKIEEYAFTMMDLICISLPNALSAPSQSSR